MMRVGVDVAGSVTVQVRDIKQDRRGDKGRLKSTHVEYATLSYIAASLSGLYVSGQYYVTYLHSETH